MIRDLCASRGTSPRALKCRDRRPSSARAEASRPLLGLAPLHVLPVLEVEPGLVVRGLDHVLAAHVVPLGELDAVRVQLMPGVLLLLDEKGLREEALEA